MSDIPSESSRASADQTELEKLLRKTKPWFEENATTLIYALAAFLAIAAVFVWMNRTSGGNAAASRDLLLAVSPEDFGDVADSYPDSDIGVWSRLRQADRLLDDAVTNLFKDRERGLEELDSAEAAYDRLAARTDLSDEVRERVLIGMARLAECHCKGDEETTNIAIAAWQRVLDEFGESIMKDHAADRIAKLATDESKSFYKWFAEQNPKPALSNDLAPGQPAVPGVPPKTIPEMFGGSEDTSTEKATEDDPKEPAADGDKPAGGDKPADGDKEESKSTEAKANVDKAAEKPAKEEAKGKSEPSTADEKPVDAKAEDAKAADDEKATEPKESEGPKPATQDIKK